MHTHARPVSRRGEPPAPPPVPVYYDGFEGVPILDEFPGTLGLVLWQRLRDVQLWTEVPRSRRKRLFRESHRAGEASRIMYEAEGLPELTRPLQAIAAVCLTPDTIDADALIVACLDISGWAAERGCPATAVAFAEAACLIDPDDADLACLAGRACRAQALHWRADEWFQRARDLARGQQKDWMPYVEKMLAWKIRTGMR